MTSGGPSGTLPPTGTPPPASLCRSSRNWVLADSCNRGASRTGFGTARSGSTPADSWRPTGDSSLPVKEERGSAPTLPISFFLRNPNAFVADFVGNNSFLQVQRHAVRDQAAFPLGLTGQFNYTFGKVLTNFAGSQSNFRGLFDNAQPHLEIMRPDFRHHPHLQRQLGVGDPLRQGRKWMNTGSFLNAIAGGWDLSGFLRVRSGETVNIVSGRGTINRGGSRALTNTVHLIGMDIKELQNRTGLFRHSEGRINLFHPSLIATSGQGNPDIFQNPGLLEAGSLAMSPVSGPWFGSLDVGLRKSFPCPSRKNRGFSSASTSSTFSTAAISTWSARRRDPGRPGCLQPPKSQQHPVRADQRHLRCPRDPGGMKLIF